LLAEFAEQTKPMAAPEGTGKKKRKKKASINADIWLKHSDTE
jgi:hypothetical protein